MIIIDAGTILTGNTAGDIHDSYAILIEHNRIARIIPAKDVDRSGHEYVDARHLVAIPGFVQTHLHLCQTLFRGMADDLQLLDWLQQRIFPFEAAHSAESMHASAMLGIAELIRSGTTTILDMGSIHHEEEVIRAVGESGLRAFVGKAMMDMNDAYPKFKETTKESLSSTRTLAEQWHNSFDGRVRYAAAPRFVLSCTDALLSETREIIHSFEGMLLHTHASENTGEVRAVRERCKKENIEFLHGLGLLSERSCLAHCIHLSDHEVDLLASTSTSVSHCPSSNLKLGSGIADVPGLVRKKVNVSLGADGAPCNNTLNMFQEMRLASLLQKPRYGPTSMPAKMVFEMATRRGAKALGLEKEIGSLEAGKKADIVLLDLQHVWDPVVYQEDLYSSVVYSASPENVQSVMIDGKWIYRNSEFTSIDQHKVVATAQKECRNLLQRM
jgi:cytosine/adenosine deaminase-related metal-dependent hydrolase